MPARGLINAATAPGAPSVDVLISGLGLLSAFGQDKSPLAKLLGELRDATAANLAAVEKVGPANDIIRLKLEAEADREKAAQELKSAFERSEEMVRHADAVAAGRIEVLNARDHDISERERIVEKREAAADERDREFENQTQAIRRALG